MINILISKYLENVLLFIDFLLFLNFLTKCIRIFSKIYVFSYNYNLLFFYKFFLNNYLFKINNKYLYLYLNVKKLYKRNHLIV